MLNIIALCTQSYEKHGIIMSKLTTYICDVHIIDKTKCNMPSTCIWLLVMHKTAVKVN